MEEETLLDLIITGRDYQGPLPEDINDYDDKEFTGAE